MRHKVAGYRLGRTKDQRLGLRRTMVNQLLTHERIQTTRAKAMFIRGETEKLITLARKSFEFGLEFRFRIIGKLIGVVATVIAALFLKEWTEEGHIHENFNAITADGDDVDPADPEGSSDPIYTWGGLLALIALSR